MVAAKRFLLFILSLYLIACASKPSFDSEQDSAPSVPRDVSAVKNAVPAPVHRTIAGNKSPYTVLGKTYTLLPESRGYKERGDASWYGQKFHGRRTSNGDVYDMYAMTAAHKTLPIPSYVKVTNLDNGRSIIVKVNDRGPFHPGRIIDLSYTGAVKLGFLNQGTARVEVEDVTPAATTNVAYLRPSPAPQTKAAPQVKAVAKAPNSVPAKGRYLQLGAFSALISAETLSSKLAGLISWPVNIIKGADQLHRVLIGPLNNSVEESDLQQQLIESDVGSGYFVNLP